MPNSWSRLGLYFVSSDLFAFLFLFLLCFNLVFAADVAFEVLVDGAKFHSGGAAANRNDFFFSLNRDSIAYPGGNGSDFAPLALANVVKGFKLFALFFAFAAANLFALFAFFFKLFGVFRHIY